MTFIPRVPTSKSECISRIEKCIKEINIRILQNLLKLNGNKTEIILFGTRQQLSKVGDVSLQIGNDTVILEDPVRNLGYIMDSVLKNGPYVNKITKSCYCMLCDITKVRPCLDTKPAQLITQAWYYHIFITVILFWQELLSTNWINSNIYETWAVMSSVISENMIMFLQP